MVKAFNPEIETHDSESRGQEAAAAAAAIIREIKEYATTEWVIYKENHLYICKHSS